jgi:ribonuclease-3
MMTNADSAARRDLASLERSLGHKFTDRDLLDRALVHASARGEASVADNENFEFLGDAVLDLAVADLLMEHHPDADQGKLSKLRASLVSEAGLDAVATQLELGQWLVLGKGEEASNGRTKPRILSGAYEAVLGAVYLDAGFSACRAIVEEHFRASLDSDALTHDSKTALQEVTQRLYKTTPSYTVIDVSGPDHDREYEVSVQLDGNELARGRGSSRKRAEQAAAREAHRSMEAGTTAGRSS